MKNSLLRKGLVLGIIVLFVGAGITTAVSAISIKNDGREVHVLKKEVSRRAEGTKGKGAESGLTHVLVDSSIDGDVSLVETEEIYDTSKLNENDEYLIKTSWGQTGLYAMKTPLKRPWGFRLNPLNHWRLGCWSTAIGQIINYHYQIQSQGKVQYQCSEIVDRFGRKVVIDNDLDDHMYDWSKMPNKLTIFSKPKEINSVSTFLYDVSTVIQKDFGTYYYVLAEGWDMVYELVDHFDKINSNSEWAVNPPVSEIENEIDNYRPCMLYMENKNGTRGHAVIIDGYKWEADNFIVHLNFGWQGPSDDWYDYDQPIKNYDSDLRGIMFIRGDFNFTAHANGPYYGQLNKELQFHGSLSGGEAPYSWHWDFGDGNTSTQQNPTHQYQSKGRYTATLTITDNSGDTSNSTAQVIITKYKSTADCKELGTKSEWLELPPITMPIAGSLSMEKHVLTDNGMPCIPINTRGDTLYVGGSGPGNYSSIQDAIDNASDGDTVFVYEYSSPYHENVEVDKSINLIGEDREEAIIQALANAFAIQVVADVVNINSFTIIGEDDDSVVLDGCRNVNITNCDIKNGYNGIYITGSASKYNYITNCEIYNNQGLGNADGIEMSGGANHNWIINCYIHDNGNLYDDDDGIRITGTTTGSNHVINCTIKDNGGGGTKGDGVEISQGANYNWIINCTISGSTNDDGAGIKIHGDASDQNHVINSTCSNNYRGIYIYKSGSSPGTGNEIKNCAVFQNTRDGIWLEGTLTTLCKYNEIMDCNAYGNGEDGISIHQSDHNTISKCNSYNNGYNGIYLKFSNNNDIINCNLSENNYGICLFRSTDNILYENTIIDNKEVGVYLQLLSNKNNIYQNNFINNAKDAFFSLSLSNTWDQNFWNKARSLPKPIFGIMGIIPWVNFDWHPAQEPYEM